MTKPQEFNTPLAILLLGYNRPELIVKRIEELGDFSPHKLVVSIDGGASPEISAQFSRIANKYANNLKEIEFWLHTENLGMVRHITGAISRILETHEYVLVIEDDITLARNYVENIRAAITAGIGFKIATFGGFSPLTEQMTLMPKNGWRHTKYFSAWGWCIQKSVWSLYSYEITGAQLTEGLKRSKTWQKLSLIQKSRWLYRFNKIVANPSLTWDYQMQFMSFKHDFENILPIFRISDNEGFADTRSTNTKALRPRWMGAEAKMSEKVVTYSVSKLVGNFVEILDSFTIAGDSKIQDVFRLGFIIRRKEL